MYGGIAGRYRDSGEQFDSGCFIDGVKCIPAEASFGSIVTYKVVESPDGD
ncbi:MAG TPA: hypothetical protein PK986_04480 [Spirochaetota bacterium]|mgnify:CR=1|nr:hypothetical protein [Spirochaetota bacterium]HQO39706.1 hypothetical protein [Spirochaetota bacterium]